MSKLGSQEYSLNRHTGSFQKPKPTNALGSIFLLRDLVCLATYGAMAALKDHPRSKYSANKNGQDLQLGQSEKRTQRIPLRPFSGVPDTGVQYICRVSKCLWLYGSTQGRNPRGSFKPPTHITRTWHSEGIICSSGTPLYLLLMNQLLAFLLLYCRHKRLKTCLRLLQ